MNLLAMTVDTLPGGGRLGDENLLVLLDEQSTMLRGGRGSVYRLTGEYIPQRCTTRKESHTSPGSITCTLVVCRTSTSELAAKTQPWTMEAKAKKGPKSLVSLGMGVKPRHGASVVLGFAIVVHQHALGHGVQYLPLLPRCLLLAEHELDVDFILLNQ